MLLHEAIKQAMLRELQEERAEKVWLSVQFSSSLLVMSFFLTHGSLPCLIHRAMQHRSSVKPRKGTHKSGSVLFHINVSKC